MMKKIWLISLLGVVLSMTSCSKSDDDDPVNGNVKVTSVSLNKSATSLLIGDEEILIATVISEEESEVKATWKTSDSKIVSVDNSGKIRAIAKGSATITALAGNKSATCQVTVTDQQVNSVTLNKTSLSLYTTDRERLKATVSPSGSYTVSWNTSDKNVVMVSSEGVVKATGVGTASITASIGGKSATCQITVDPAVLAISHYGGTFGSAEVSLWKNGKKWVLKDKIGASVSSMFVYEGDVYIVGTSHAYSYNATDNRAILMKITSPIPGENPHPDDEEQYIMETSGKESRGYGVYVSNGDMYVCGEERTLQEGYTNVYYRRATLWKNGKKQYLTTNTYGEHNAANAVFVSGNDVYVTGRAEKRATLWKNGVAQELPCAGTVDMTVYDVTDAQDLFVSGNDIYVVGAGSFPPTGSYQIPTRKPVVWKNGVAQVLRDDYGYLYSVYVSGNDVYAVGSNGELWKNGVLELVSDGKPLLESVCVYGNDVYVSGYESTTFNRLWKNGNPISLEGEPSLGTVYSVVVK